MIRKLYIVNFYENKGTTGYYIVAACSALDANTLVIADAPTTYEGYNIRIISTIETETTKCSEDKIIETKITNTSMSAYDLYVAKGGTLSEEEWLASLKGDTGNTGSTGATGEAAVMYELECAKSIAVEGDLIGIDANNNPVGYELHLYKIVGSSRSEMTWSEMQAEELLASIDIAAAKYILWNENFRGIYTESPLIKGTYAINIVDKNRLQIAHYTFTVVPKAAEGDSISIEYSKDGLTAWHEDYSTDDYYIRFNNTTAKGKAIRFVGSLGPAGLSGSSGSDVCRLSLDNIYDSIQYDENNNRIGDPVTSLIYFYQGKDLILAVPKVSSNINATNVTITPATGNLYKLTVGGIIDGETSASVTVLVVYENAIYLATMVIKKLINANKYLLLVTPSIITVNASTLELSSDNIKIQILKTDTENNITLLLNIEDLIANSVIVKINNETFNASKFTDGCYTIDLNMDKIVGTPTHNITLVNSDTGALLDQCVVDSITISNGTSTLYTKLSFTETIFALGDVEAVFPPNNKPYYKLVSPGVPEGEEYDFYSHELSKMPTSSYTVNNVTKKATWHSDISDIDDKYYYNKVFYFANVSEFQTKYPTGYTDLIFAVKNTINNSEDWYKWDDGSKTYKNVTVDDPAGLKTLINKYWTIGTINQADAEPKFDWKEPSIYGADYVLMANNMLFVSIDYSVLAKNVSFNTKDYEVIADNIDIEALGGKVNINEDSIATKAKNLIMESDADIKLIANQAELNINTDAIALKSKDIIMNSNDTLLMIADKVKVESNQTTFTGEVNATSFNVGNILGGEFKATVKITENHYTDNEGNIKLYDSLYLANTPVIVILDSDGLPIYVVNMKTIEGTNAGYNLLLGGYYITLTNDSCVWKPLTLFFGKDVTLENVLFYTKINSSGTIDTSSLYTGDFFFISNTDYSTFYQLNFGTENTYYKNQSYVGEKAPFVKVQYPISYTAFTLGLLWYMHIKNGLADTVSRAINYNNRLGYTKLYKTNAKYIDCTNIPYSIGVNPELVYDSNPETNRHKYYPILVRIYEDITEGTVPTDLSEAWKGFYYDFSRDSDGEVIADDYLTYNIYSLQSVLANQRYIIRRSTQLKTMNGFNDLAEVIYQYYAEGVVHDQNEGGTMIYPLALTDKVGNIKEITKLTELIEWENPKYKELYKNFKIEFPVELKDKNVRSYYYDSYDLPDAEMYINNYPKLEELKTLYQG